MTFTCTDRLNIHKDSFQDPYLTHFQALSALLEDMSKIIYCFFLFFGTITELLLNISGSFWIKQLHYQLAKTTDGILLHSYQLMNLVSTKLRVATSFVVLHSHQLITS